MNDPITGTIKVGDKTGSVTSYTVQEYLNTLTTGSYDDKTKNLANALKDYGHYAQITLDEAHDEWTLGTDHTEIQANNNNIGTTITDTLSDYPFTNNTGSSGYYTLDLDSKITLNVYFPKDMAGASGATSTVAKMGEDATTGKKTEYEAAVDTKVTPKEDGNYYALSFGDISAHEFDNKYTITVGGKTIEIYPLSYIKTILDTTTTYEQAGVKDDTQLTHLKQAIVALYNYYTATVAYRAKPND